MRLALAVRLRPRTIALDAMFLAIGVCAAAFVMAWRTDPLPTSAEPANPVRVAAASEGHVEPGAGAIAATVDAGPFRPDRTRPMTRYRLGGPSAVLATAPVSGGRRFVPPVRLQGIVVLPGGGGMAALSVQGRPPQLVRRGEMFEGFRLVRVRPDAATLVGPDTTLVLQLPGARRQPL